MHLKGADMFEMSCKIMAKSLTVCSYTDRETAEFLSLSLKLSGEFTAQWRSGELKSAELKVFMYCMKKQLCKPYLPELKPL